MSKRTSYRLLAIVSVMVLLLTIGTLGLAKQALGNQTSSLSPKAEGTEATEDDPLLTAIVAVKAASGASYIADREYIATMPELKTIEEMREFVARYEPLPQDMQTVHAYLKSRGFTITAQDNLFLVVSGTPSQFNKMLRSPDALTWFLEADSPRELRVVRAEELQIGRASVLKLIDGMLINPPAASGVSVPPNQKRTEKQIANTQGCSPPDCYTIDDVAHLLGADRVHQETSTGIGVRIGFIDEGPLQSHPFFNDHPLNARYYKLVDGHVTQVNKNSLSYFKYEGHGTMVAAFLATFAPDAELFSFAYEGDNAEILLYLTQLHQYDLDLLSLSQGSPEEYRDNYLHVADIRTQMLNLMADGVIVLVAAGNADQQFDGSPSSGHNGLAAIPEVIAVGGADTDFTAAGGYGGPSGAASFDSEVYADRHVPDVVGIYGPVIHQPTFSEIPILVFNKWPYGYSDDACGTSGATPQIAGIVALLKERYPSVAQYDAREILQKSTWDITSGESGDGQPASLGYDEATGYGLPFAHRVMSDVFVWYPGWNLVGLTKEPSGNYTAVDMLNEINAQGYSCDNVSRWVPSKSRYEGIVMEEDGQIFGFDFSLELGVGYWVRCDKRVVWKPSDAQYLDAPQTIHIKRGS